MFQYVTGSEKTRHIVRMRNYIYSRFYYLRVVKSSIFAGMDELTLDLRFTTLTYVSKISLNFQAPKTSSCKCTELWALITIPS